MIAHKGQTNQQTSMLPLGLHPVYLAGLAVLALGILFHIIGLATPSWSVLDFGGNSITRGLFRGCLDGTCYDYEGLAPDKIKACQAMALMGFISALIGVAFTVFHIMKPRLGRTQDTRIPLYAAIDCIFACFITVICAIVWATAVKEDTEDLGYSFVLSIIGGILISIGGILMYIVARRTVGYDSVP